MCLSIVDLCENMGTAVCPRVILSPHSSGQQHVVQGGNGHLIGLISPVRCFARFVCIVGWRVSALSLTSVFSEGVESSEVLLLYCS